MRRTLALFGAAALLAASPARACDAEAAASLVGAPADTETVERAQELSGAATVRVIEPGMAVTQEFREDRLNIETDEEGTITRLRCG